MSRAASCCRRRVPLTVRLRRPAFLEGLEAAGYLQVSSSTIIHLLDDSTDPLPAHSASTPLRSASPSASSTPSPRCSSLLTVRSSSPALVFARCVACTQRWSAKGKLLTYPFIWRRQVHGSTVQFFNEDPVSDPFVHVMVGSLPAVRQALVTPHQLPTSGYVAATCFCSAWTAN